MPEGLGVLITGAVGAAAFGSLFAAGDAALTALPEGRLAAVTQAEGSPFLRYTDDRDRILSRWLVCRVIAISTATALLDLAAGELVFGQWRTPFSIAGAVLLYATFAEILGSIARRSPERIGAIALRLLRPAEWVVAVVAEPLALLGRFVARFAPERPVDARLTETEVAWVVDEGQKTGTLDREPAELIRNVLEFKDITAREVMVPRTRISGVEVSTPVAEVRHHVSSEGHSRYPVYRESLDHVVGLLYAKDIFQGEKPVEKSIRPNVLFVAESQSIASILREMRARRLHMAIVTDEYGGTSGIITLEDILEEIVGDIRDEHDVEPAILELGNGRLVADASISLADLGAHLNRELPNGDFESLGGLVVHRVGHVPAVGATLQVDDLKLIVREADQTRVVKVEIIQPEAT
jgi:CBS domain containing-hemolysin-like protein